MCKPIKHQFYVESLLVSTTLVVADSKQHNDCFHFGFNKYHIIDIRKSPATCGSCLVSKMSVPPFFYPGQKFTATSQIGSFFQVLLCVALAFMTFPSGAKREGRRPGISSTPSQGGVGLIRRLVHGTYGQLHPQQPTTSIAHGARRMKRSQGNEVCTKSISIEPHNCFTTPIRRVTCKKSTTAGCTVIPAIGYAPCEPDFHAIFSAKCNKTLTLVRGCLCAA